MTYLQQYNSNQSLYLTVTHDNRIKVWDVTTGHLRQEYVNADHLSHKYTCVAWLECSPSKKNKSQKKRGKDSEMGVVAVGSNTGIIFIWDLVKGEVVQKLGDSTHDNTPINDIAFNSNGSILFSCTNERHILEWDVTNGEVIRKLKGSKEGVSKLAVSSNDGLLAVGSTSIRLIDLSSGKKAKSITSGHSASIQCLQFTSCGKYLLSSSCKGRYINCFSCEDESSQPLRIFNLDDSPISFFTRMLEGETLQVGAVSETGILYLWESILCQDNEIDSVSASTKTVCDAGEDELKVLSAAFTPSSLYMLSIARGSIGFPKFEGISFGDKSGFFKTLTLKTISTELLSNEKDKKMKINEVDMEVDAHVMALSDRGHVKTSTLKKMVMEEEDNAMTDNEMMDENEPTLAERVAQLREAMEEDDENFHASIMEEDNQIQSQITLDKQGTPQASSLVKILEQALQSKDKNMIEYCLNMGDKQVIEATVKRLPSIKVIPFLEFIVERFQANPRRAVDLLKWIQSLLVHHNSYLMTVPDLIKNLSNLYQIIEMRLNVFQPLYKLSSRLDFLMGQIDKQQEGTDYSNETPQVIYNEDDDPLDNEGMQCEEDEPRVDKDEDENEEEDEEEDEEDDEEDNLSEED